MTLAQEEDNVFLIEKKTNKQKMNELEDVHLP